MLVRRSGGALSSDFPSGKVVFDTVTRTPYVLNGTAAEIWNLCKRPSTPDSLAKYLRDQYGVSGIRAKRDVGKFIRELKTQNLIK